jgi:flagellar biosynthesis protein FlhF
VAKRELGPQLELVTTHEVREGGFLGLGGRRIFEVTVACEQDDSPVAGRAVMPRSALLGGGVPGPAAVLGLASRGVPAAIERPRSVVEIDLAYDRRDSIGGGRGWDGRWPQEAPVAPANSERRLPDERGMLLGAIARSDADRLRQEAPLDSIAGAVDAVLCRDGDGGAGTGAAGRLNLPGRLLDTYAALLEQELDRGIADRALQEAREMLAPASWEDPGEVRAAVQSALARLLPEPPAPAPSRGGARTISLIGPTGVGKTTTIAKLAALLKLRLHLRVGLITCDTYRIAAVEQLRTYAEIIGLPLIVVQDPAEMRTAKERLRDLDAVLVDTAGRSQNDTARLRELAEFVDAAEADEVHLVLSAVAGRRVLQKELEAYAAIRADRVVLTKLDEAVTFGPLFSLLAETGRSASYLCTGQEVPEHIEPATAQRLADLVLGGMVRA